MKRLVSMIAAALFVASVSTATLAADSSMKGMSGMSSGSMSMKKMSCPKGQTYVKGYTKKDGTKVKGYCRKAGKM